MKRFSFQLLAAGMLCGALLVGACGNPGKQREPIGDIPASATLGDDEVRTLLIKGAGLYAELAEIGSQEKGIVAGRPASRVDPKRASSLAALRAHLRAAFTDAAADSVLADYGVTEEGGKLWMTARDEDGDIRSYDESEVTSIESDGEDIVADVEVPLGDSGQTDEFQVRFTRVGQSWRIASDPFGGDEGEN